MSFTELKLLYSVIGTMLRTGQRSLNIPDDKTIKKLHPPTVVLRATNGKLLKLDSATRNRRQYFSGGIHAYFRYF
jgi:hypothetical protein